MDAHSLYTNIKHKDGILALRKSFNNRQNKDPPIDMIITLLQQIFSLNNFPFNGKNSMAMGTVFAPSYATIYMGYFEETHIYPKIKNGCAFYVRYIDDIFLIYTGIDRSSLTNP